MDRPGARVAIGTWLAGLAAMALVGSVHGSPLQPPLADAEGAGSLLALFRAVAAPRITPDDPVAVIAGVCAIVLVVLGFLLVARAAWQGRLSLRAAVVLTGIGCALVLALPLLYSRDVYSYALYGRIAAVYDLNPYVVTPSQVADDAFFPLVGAQWRETTSVYGPVFTGMSVGLTRALEAPSAVVIAFRAISVLAVLATSMLIAWTARQVRPERAALAVALFGLNPAVLFQTAGSGHNDALVALALAAALAFVLSGRAFAVTVTLVIGALVKSTCGVALLLWLVVAVARRHGPGRWKTLAAHLGLGACIVFLAALPFLGGGDLTLGQTQLVDHEGWLAPARAVRVIAEGIGDAVSASTGDALGTIVRVVFAAALVATVGAIAVVAARTAAGARAGDPLDVEAVGAAWGWGFLALMFLGPVLLPWYVAWGLPVAWTLPRIPRHAMIALSVLLMLSLFAADAVTFPDAFQLTAKWANYVLAPIVLVVGISPARDLIARVRSRSDLTGERTSGALL